jgi:oligosaccharyltransferase complex subunit epsilon
MAPKQRTTAEAGTASTPVSRPSKSSSGTNTDASAIAQGIWSKYTTKTPQRSKLLDTFMAFLVVVGALQFAYVVVVGNFVRAPTTISRNIAIESFLQLQLHAVKRLRVQRNF